MTHGDLSVKLNQLDDRMARLHSLIQISETSDPGTLRQKIALLEKECLQSEANLWEILQHSRSALVAVLAESCEQMEQVIQNTRKQIDTLEEESGDEETVVEEKLLMAEYALDFAHQTADRALLFSLKAIDAQMAQQQGIQEK